MGGGGARAGYQVGFLRCLARRHPELRIPILTGVSAGAINAAFLASHHGTFEQAVRELAGLWANLTVDEVFRVDFLSLARHVATWGLHLVSGGFIPARGLRSLVDTEPLRGFLNEALHAVDGELTGVRAALARGELEALAITASSYTTGKSVTWVEGAEIRPWRRPRRQGRRATITVDHVMASAAIPLLFPAVRIGDEYFGDGGIRLTAPLSPALHLGADRVMVISTRHEPRGDQREEPAVVGYPPPAQVMGTLLNTVFLDQLDQDVLHLERLNELVNERGGETATGLRPVDLLTLRPSRDLGRLALDYEQSLPRGFRFLTRGWGTRETRSADMLSWILFEPDYLRRLMDEGEADAEAQCDEIERFLSSGAETGEPAASGARASPA